MLILKISNFILVLDVGCKNLWQERWCYWSVSAWWFTVPAKSIWFWKICFMLSLQNYNFKKQTNKVIFLYPMLILKEWQTYLRKLLTGSIIAWGCKGAPPVTMLAYFGLQLLTNWEGFEFSCEDFTFFGGMRQVSGFLIRPLPKHFCPQSVLNFVLVSSVSVHTAQLWQGLCTSRCSVCAGPTL